MTVTDLIQYRPSKREAFARENHAHVIGVGGAGCNTCHRLSKIGVKGTRIIAINTEAQQLETIHSDRKVLIGQNVTEGFGARGDPILGRKAVQESTDVVLEAIRDADVAYIIAGFGGGTGTGAAPTVAKMCRDSGALVVGVVTLPFQHEGGTKISIAAQGLTEMQRYCNTVIAIQNDRLMELVSEISPEDAFEIADKMAADMIKGAVEAVSAPSITNLDFSDFRAIVERGDIAVIGIGESDAPNGTGAPNRAEEAAKEVMSCPLLAPIDYREANGALISVAGDEAMTLAESVRVGEIISGFMNGDARVFWGPRIDPDLKGILKVTLILTGVDPLRLLPKPRRLPEIRSRHLGRPRKSVYA